jgi:manganese oxidase
MPGVFGATVPGSRIGTKYKRAMYVEYTDATFSTQKAQPAWQGSLGPTLRAEVR